MKPRANGKKQLETPECCIFMGTGDSVPLTLAKLNQSPGPKLHILKRLPTGAQAALQSSKSIRKVLWKPTKGRVANSDIWPTGKLYLPQIVQQKAERSQTL